jgi:Cu/Ag efflux pump CusA
MAIAVGGVVDDAIINVENILRRLRENRLREAPLPAHRVVLDASIEVQSAVVLPTIVVAMVFIPVLTLPGLAGRLFFPMGVAYIIATLASLVVAMTVTPALSLLFLGGRKGRAGEPPVIGILKRGYAVLLRAVERHVLAAAAVVVLVALAGASVIPLLGAEFLPELHEGHFLVHMSMIPGTSLDESSRVGDLISRDMLAVDGVRSVAQRVGRAEADDTFGTHQSEYEIDLSPGMGGEANDAAKEGIRRVFESYPGLRFAMNSFLTERIEETLSGFTSAVVVNIFGKDLDRLDRLANQVAGAVAGVPGAADVQVQSPPGTPALSVDIRQDDVQRWGLAPVDVLDAIRTAFQGVEVGEVHEGGRTSKIVVILSPDARKDPSQVGALPLRNREGTWVTLSRLADIHESSGRYVVLHEATQRVQTVTCNVEGRDVGSFVDEARRKVLSTVDLGEDDHVQFGGTAEEQSRSNRDLLVHALIVGVAIVLLLGLTTRSPRNLLLLLLNLPFALIGGLLVIPLSGGTVSIGSLVGFVTVCGITLRNSMMMFSHFEHLVLVEGRTWGPETALRGASERLAPILMTAMVTALGLLPLALGGSEPGREIEGPMAVVILGGLLTSTVLNLLVLPALALRFGRFTAPGGTPGPLDTGDSRPGSW